MKVIKNMLLEIVTLILLVINLYMFFFYSEWNCEDSADHTGRI